MEGNLPPGGAYIWRGDLKEGFLRYEFGGLYLEGLIFGILRYFFKESITILQHCNYCLVAFI